ncbi:SPOSA6832_03455, partial [Sporobolomyces salmonicolor]
MTVAARPLLVDVHSHVYPPSYMELMRKRAQIPKIIKGADGGERVVLLKEEEGKGANSKGRPVGPQYWDRDEKIKFMDTHGIDVTQIAHAIPIPQVVSLANPWLDFLEPAEATQAAHDLNLDVQSYCASFAPSSSSSSSFSPLTEKRLFGFGSLPLVPGIETKKVVEAVKQIKGLSYLRGVVMGTKGIGKGLDDPGMEPIWEAIAAAGLVVFVVSLRLRSSDLLKKRLTRIGILQHPHYGIENAFGEQDNGHVLALGLGFPFETTIAIARLILSGVLDRHPTLKLLLAHSAGALPALSSRLSSCVVHDPHVKDRLQHDFRYYLGQMWYDAVTYGPEELALVERVVSRANGYEGKEEQIEFVDRVTTRAHAPEGAFPGVDRIMFGTDHPFFPPLDGEGTRWKSVDENLDAIAGVAGWGADERAKVMGGNAVELFDLEL